MGILLEAKSLQKRLYRFKNFKRESNLSVKNVSLCVHEGEIVGLLGPNGAGKSTSLKMITGDLTPDEGRVIFNGQDITEWPMYKRCSAGLGYMPQENTLFKQLTVENNLIGIMQMQGFTQKECQTRCGELMELFNLYDIRNNLAGNISGGEKRRLEVARALTSRPKMLILDEPFAGVDPKVTQSVIDLVFDLWKNWGIAILITDHDYLHIIQMVQRCYVISSGEVVFEGEVDDLINDPIVQRDYLGNVEQQIITVDENGRKRVKNRHNFDQAEGVSNLQTSISQNDGQNESAAITTSQNALPSEDSVIEQLVSENGAESTQQETETASDSDLSELLQPVQTSEFQTSEQDNAPSPTLSDFINQNDSQSGAPSSYPSLEQEDESDAEEPTNPTNNQQQRKAPPSGPVIKPFRRKK
ncbi:MAG: LPS export ABC transporter ATP-binding protein [Thermoguttaceae bacterium]|nr:LPS export ABC transporter ATP-binding protein [Thermoguttaceae bacterium]